MTYVRWFGCAAAVFIVLELLQLPLRKKNRKVIFALLLIIKFTAAIVIAYYSMAVCNRLVWNLGYLPAVLYAVLLCDAFADLAFLVILLLRKKEMKAITMTLISLIITAAYMCYGTVNMQTITPREHSYTSDKLKHDYKIVFLADLHYGSAQSAKTVEKVLSDIRNMKPDFVLLGGDITDERTTEEEMKLIYKQIGKLGVPTFFMYGIDKLKAKRSKWRISEAALLWMAVIGGSIGAWLGIKIWHHKTRHKKFKYGIPFILLIQIAIVLTMVH